MSQNNGKNKKKKAVGLLSGGLDSTLAVRVMTDMGYDVTALNIETPFCNCSADIRCTQTKRSANLKIDYKRAYAGQDYVELVKNPLHGHGKNMNICIDCRIYMLKKAKTLMEDIGAEVVFTGEVVGQRPMSQHTRALKIVEEESGLKGRLLRPLSGKLLKPTILEEKGNISRDQLFDIQGRGRKAQMRMAEQFQIEKYPSPAGGCMLTDEAFAERLRDAFKHGEDSLQSVSTLKYGRHFRLEDGAKIIAGRTEKENKMLKALCDANTTVFTVHGLSSTYTFLDGDLTDRNMRFAGGVAARYSKGKHLESVEIKWWSDNNGSNEAQLFSVKPLSDDELKKYKI